jgi:DedD protein
LLSFARAGDSRDVYAFASKGDPVNSLYEDDEQGGRAGKGDRELTLGTGTLLGIFFAAALVCAAFFGFGYTMGRRTAKPLPVATQAENDTASDLPTTTVKPSAGSPAVRPASATSARSESSAAPENETDSGRTQRSSGAQTSSSSATHASVPAPTRTPPDATEAPVSRTQAAPTAATPGIFVVQIAAVSHQEDADILVSALKRRGYAVAVRHEPQDSLLHVQIATTFPIRKDAEAMRQRLIGDGYNAIVK